jgi:hypothetical protein
MIWDFTKDRDKKDYEDFYGNYEEFYEYMRYSNTNFVKIFDLLTNKEKQKVIAFYISNAENLMSNTMYSKIINELIIKDDYGYDEIIMNKFKVLGVYSIENGRFAFNHDNAQSIIEEMGYKYLGHIPETEFKNVTPEVY